MARNTPQGRLNHDRKSEVAGMSDRRGPRRTTLYCSECGKGDHETSGLVMMRHVNLCDECIRECVAALALRAKMAGTPR
jgi:hypothetical protein